jgi:hypothetical protein
MSSARPRPCRVQLRLLRDLLLLGLQLLGLELALLGLQPGAYIRSLFSST